MTKSTSSQKSERKQRRNFVGVVVSNKMAKTIMVETFRMEKHSRYGKYMKKNSLFKAHDEKSEAKLGDKVRIVETRPLSKTKFFKLDSVVEKNKRG